MLLPVLLISFLGLVAECAYQDLSHSKTGTNSAQLGICKGQRTTLKEIPFLASIKVKSALFGTGVILNKRWILTSAFNVKWWEPEDLEIRTGSVKYDAGGQVLKVSKIVCHEEYNGGWNNNIALVMTEKDIRRKGAEIGTGELPAGTSVKVAGWGATEASSVEPSPFLLNVNLSVLDWNQCNETYSPDLTSSMICTSVEDVGPCMGDSGGPLIHEGLLYGIYSGTKDNMNSPKVYTNVTAHSEWIGSIIQN